MRNNCDKVNIKAVFAFLILFYSCGQSVMKMPTNKINRLLCQKWSIGRNSDLWAATKDSGLKIESLSPAELSPTVEFISNGFVKFDNSKGTWVYNKKEHSLIIKLHNKVMKYTIRKLTDRKVILEYKEKDEYEKQILLWREDGMSEN